MEHESFSLFGLFHFIAVNTKLTHLVLLGKISRKKTTLNTEDAQRIVLSELEEQERFWRETEFPQSLKIP